MNKILIYMSLNLFQITHSTDENNIIIDEKITSCKF